MQRAASCLEALSDTDYCLSAGGDMVCQVVDPSAPARQVGIEDPYDPTRLVARIPVRSGAIATSGVTHRGTHIIDATAAFAMGPGALDWLTTRPGRCGVVVWAGGSAQVFGTLN